MEFGFCAVPKFSSILSQVFPDEYGLSIIILQVPDTIATFETQDRQRPIDELTIDRGQIIALGSPSLVRVVLSV